MKKLQIFEPKLGDGFSLDLGSGEIAKSNQADLNSGTEYTVGLWVKPDAVNVDGTMFDCPSTFFGSRVLMESLGATSSGRFKITITDSGGTFKIQKEYDGALSAGVWTLITFSHIFSPFRNFVYFDGVQTAPTNTIQNLAAGQGGQDRTVHIGSNGVGGGSSQFPARYHSAMWWNKELTVAAILETYNSGNGKDFDMLTDSGNYASADDLQHWWRLGLNGIIGKDFGITPVDVLGFTNVDASDIVKDSPA